MLANCILSGKCDQFGNTGDLTSDGAFNDLDIVLMVSIILEGWNSAANCITNLWRVNAAELSVNYDPHHKNLQGAKSSCIAFTSQLNFKPYVSN